MDPNDTVTPVEPAEASVIEAMDAGIEAATPEAPPADPPVVEAPAADPPVPGTPEALAADQAAADKVAADAAKPPAPEKDAEVEKEITDLGLKEKAATRHRELSAKVKELAPLKDALDKAGVKDPEQLATFLKRNEAMTSVMDMVTDTGATSEQFGQTLDYLSLVTKAGQGDRKSAEQAFELVTRERNELAKALGIEVDGFDPLAEFPDLKAEAEAGDTPRPRALELAQKRRDDALRSQATERQRQEADSRQAQETANAQAIQTGRDALNALERELAADPQYPAKKAALYAEVNAICKDNPPAQWASLARYAYRAIAAPAATKPPPGPMRAGQIRPAVAPVTDDPMEALNIGIAQAG